MSRVLQRLLAEDHIYWTNLVNNYEEEVKALRVPTENSTVSLQQFNSRLDELFARASFDLSRATRNKEAMEALLKNVLETVYGGANDKDRKSISIKMAQEYPTGIPNYPVETVDLFEYMDSFNFYYLMMKSTMKVLVEKEGSKITNNSLLKIDSTMTIS
jgi:hypothetical protein